MAALEGPLEVFAYFGFMTAVGFLVIYAVTNVGLISYPMLLGIVIGSRGSSC